MERAELETLYGKYGPLVLRRARVLLGNEQAAKDAMQEVFMRVFQTLAEFKGQSSPVTWLYRVTTNHCLNVIRDEGRRAQLLAERGPQESVSAPRVEAQMTITEILARVPEELCEIAVYYFVDQMNQDEIAEQVGVSRRTVGNRIEEFRRAALEVAA